MQSFAVERAERLRALRFRYRQIRHQANSKVQLEVLLHQGKPFRVLGFDRDGREISTHMSFEEVMLRHSEHRFHAAERGIEVFQSIGRTVALGYSAKRALSSLLKGLEAGQRRQHAQRH